MTSTVSLNPIADSVSSDTASTDVVTLSRADILKMINDAVAAGVASAVPVATLGQPAAPVVEKWSANQLLHAMLHRMTFHTEGEHRAARLAVDTHFPEPADEAEVTA